MSVIHTWTCFLLWISVTVQEKTPDVTVKCFISTDCVLPCNFQPGRDETVEWFKQNELLYKIERNNNSSKEYFKHHQVAEHSSISSIPPQQISAGNATLILRRGGLKDRGVYRCHVRTAGGEHKAKVILKVEAPIRGLFLELTRLSGFKEIKCSVRDVYPAPRITWVIEPPTGEVLRPVTRKVANETGLFIVESRLKRVEGKPDLFYICKVTTSSDSPTWTSSFRDREITGTEGKDLTLPCRTPSNLNNPSLVLKVYWTFNRDEKFSQIISYDSRSGRSVPPLAWDNHVKLDINRVQSGDGSLSLMDPKPSEHTGSYTCEFSLQYNKHTEHNDVIISHPQADPKGLESREPSYWWIIGVVAAVLLLALGGILMYRKLRGKTSNSRNDPEEETELNRVKDAAALT